MPKISILIPTYNRHAALAATLTSLCYQEYKDFEVVIADQSDDPVAESQNVQAVVRLLEFHGSPVRIVRNLPRRGIAQQSQFLLEQAGAPYCLYLGDDVLLEPYVLKNLITTIQEEACGYVGNAVIGLSCKDDVRPDQQSIDLWEGTVKPEYITPDSPQWQRYMLHNAANVLHVQQRLGAMADKPIKYKVAWVGGCVLFDAAKLREAGGFSFWTELPPKHCGEDVLAQLRVMKRYGGCGLLPSGAYHQELPTTIPETERKVDAPKCLQI